MSIPGDHPQDACGVVGVYAPDEDVARVAFSGCTPSSIGDRRA